MEVLERSNLVRFVRVPIIAGMVVRVLLLRYNSVRFVRVPIEAGKVVREFQPRFK